jgi:hypothetical protein
MADNSIVTAYTTTVMTCDSTVTCQHLIAIDRMMIVALYAAIARLHRAMSMRDKDNES